MPSAFCFPRRASTLILPAAFLFTAAAAFSADVWVAVGYGGRRMISTDGKTWEITGEWAQPGGDDSNNLISAVYAQGKFVAVGGGGGGPTAAGHILVSTDGREWKETHLAKSRIAPIVFGNGRFVVGSSVYPSGRLMWSADAETWTPGAQIATKSCTHFRGGAFGNGVFVFTGNGGGSGGISWCVVSPDGEKITSERADLPGQGRILFGAGHFVMMTGNSNVGLITSKDGITWTPAALPDEGKVNWLTNAGNLVLAGNGKTAFATSDGVKWTVTDMPARGNVMWSDGKRFITTGWPGKMGYSDDGKTWLPANEQTANGINKVVSGSVGK